MLTRAILGNDPRIRIPLKDIAAVENRSIFLARGGLDVRTTKGAIVTFVAPPLTGWRGFIEDLRGRAALS